MVEREAGSLWTKQSRTPQKALAIKTLALAKKELSCANQGEN